MKKPQKTSPKKKDSFIRRTISVPRALDTIIKKEVKKQKATRNVNYSSFVVEMLASDLVK